MLYKENQGIQKANRILEDQIELLKQTSHIGARNYVARELHDIIGHSLVVSMKLLEVCKISYYKNREKARNSLENAKEILLLGMEEMEAVKEKETGVIFNSESLEREIRTMLRTVDISGLTTKFFVRGNCNSLSEKMFDIIKKILMELVTNSLKHGNASTLFISIMFQIDEIEINFMDNGKGVASLIKGNGLKGIDFRLTLVQGNAEYETSEGNGFQVKMKIPMNR
jgi:signal transduction histidine kinase